jgi:GTP-dependent phosphoenolpyruvate carboxykinase
MRLDSILLLAIAMLSIIAVIIFAVKKQEQQPGYEIKLFMDSIKYGKDPRRGVCYAINPNYGYVFTYIPCEIQK